MADKSRERNSVDLFSDYGLDERQKNISSEIGFRSFKLLVNRIIPIMTGAWLCFSLVEDMPRVHPAIIALSYYAAIMVSRWVYAVHASKAGVINQITAFSSTTGFAIVVTILLALVGLLAAGTALCTFSGAEDTEFLAVFFGILLIDTIVMYVCGKRNFRELDSQTEEEE